MCSSDLAYTLTQHEQRPALEVPETDSAGVRNPQGFKGKLRARFSQAAVEQIAKPTAAEVKEIESHH